MRILLILAIYFLCCSQYVLAKSKRVLKLNGKGITDVSDLKVPNRIRVLQLSSNSITSLEGLVLPSKLRFLDLDLNELINLNGVNFNEALEFLEISGNPTIVDYSNLANIQSLKSLTLAVNNLSKDSFDFNLITANLEFLVVGGNFFTDLNLTQFRKLQKLNMKSMFPASKGAEEYLLDYSKVILPESLKILFIGGNDFGDQDFSQLVLPDGIEEIDMATSSLDQDELKTLTLPANLKKLRLKRNNISTLDDLEFPESLEELNLQLNPLTKEEKQKIKARFGKKVKVIFKCNTNKCRNSA